ncbi:tRNA adenosine(34) deaminase TadA [Pseudoteredinibacter isoporae]|uniref:tRNA adenosine(34) deaminase TadA n=1 Tax=Pseudoteredinibacter isoporae TaxID=570281 RepID=UPI00310C7652
MNERNVLSREDIAKLSPLEQDEYWMRHCMVLAEQAADAGEVPVGAVVVRDHELIAEAFNQPISTHDPCAHAEIMALRKAGQTVENYRLSDCTLYVSLEPCSMCAGALVHSRVSRLVFGATEPKAGVIESQGEFLNSPFLNHHLEWQGGVLAKETSAQLSDFFKRRRAQKKANKAT